MNHPLEIGVGNFDLENFLLKKSEIYIAVHLKGTCIETHPTRAAYFFHETFPGLKVKLEGDRNIFRQFDTDTSGVGYIRPASTYPRKNTFVIFVVPRKT